MGSLSLSTCGTPTRITGLGRCLTRKPTCFCSPTQWPACRPSSTPCMPSRQADAIDGVTWPSKSSNTVQTSRLFCSGARTTDELRPPLRHAPRRLTWCQRRTRSRQGWSLGPRQSWSAALKPVLTWTRYSERPAGSHWGVVTSGAKQIPAQHKNYRKISFYQTSRPREPDSRSIKGNGCCCWWPCGGTGTCHLPQARRRHHASSTPSWQRALGVMPQNREREAPSRRWHCWSRRSAFGWWWCGDAWCSSRCRRCVTRGRRCWRLCDGRTPSRRPCVRIRCFGCLGRRRRWKKMVTVVWFHEHEMPKELSRLDYVLHHNWYKTPKNIWWILYSISRKIQIWIKIKTFIQLIFLSTIQCEYINQFVHSEIPVERIFMFVVYSTTLLLLSINFLSSRPLVIK